MSTSSASASMDSIIADLWRQQANAIVKVQFAWASDDAAKDATLANLETDGSRIKRLEDVLKPQVLAGSFEFSRWSAIAQTVHEDINFQSGLTDTWTWSAVVASTVSQTAQTVAAKGEAIANASPYIGSALVIALVAIALIYITFAFRSAT